jgi:hypothetical protein
MLTSKEAARIVNSSSADISIPTIQHGEEEFALDMQLNTVDGCEECADIDSNQDSEASYHECACERRQGESMADLDGRTPEKEICAFFKRLDDCWNKSETRFCSGCGMFQSTSAKHWERKAQSYQYKRIGRLARWWRKGDYEYSVDSIEYG